jgi:hypothetical protein
VIRVHSREYSGQILLRSLTEDPLRSQNDLVSFGAILRAELVIRIRVQKAPSQVPNSPRPDRADLFWRVWQANPRQFLDPLPASGSTHWPQSKRHEEVCSLLLQPCRAVTTFAAYESSNAMFTQLRNTSGKQCRPTSEHSYLLRNPQLRAARPA